MSFFEKLLNLKNLFRIIASKRTPEPDVIQETTKDKSPEKVPEAVDKRVRVSGYNVTYTVPKDMSKIIVRLLSPNGTFKAEYTLTQYLDIKPGERVQLIVKT